MMFIALLAAAAAACAPAPQAGVVRQPAFLSAPSTADLLAAIPATAAQNGVSGEADLACRADEAGYLTDCRVVSEEPAGMGFGEAALTLSTRYHLATLSAGGVAVACREVEIPVEFSVEGGDWRAARVDMVTRPTWTAAPSFDDLAGAWHGEDVEGPVRVVLDCQVRPDGSLERCRSEASSPFARAARSLAKDFRLDLRPGEFTPHRTLAVEVPIELRDPQSPAFQARA
ncbi:MAG: hypothetical protein ACREEX_09190, partial [Caulobacteraceae bacterium]